MGNGMSDFGTKSPFRKKSINRELERYCKPNGLYDSCPYDEKTVRKWILDGKVAPRYHGTDRNNQATSLDVSDASTSVEGSSSAAAGAAASNFDGSSHQGRASISSSSSTPTAPPSSSLCGTEECPICFMNYEGVNTTTCCGKPLCTECFLQCKPPRAAVTCPFCNSSRFNVQYLGKMSPEDRERKEMEEQRVIEATIRARVEHAKVLDEERQKRRNTDANQDVEEGEGGTNGSSTNNNDAGAGAGAGAAAASDGAGGDGLSSSGTEAGGSGEIRSRATSGAVTFATVAERRRMEEELRRLQCTPTRSPRGGNASRRSFSAGDETEAGGSRSGAGGAAAASTRRGSSGAAGGRGRGRRRVPGGGVPSDFDGTLSELAVLLMGGGVGGEGGAEADGSGGEGGSGTGSRRAFVGDGDGAISQVENLMLMEAMRLSVMDEQRRLEKEVRGEADGGATATAEEAGGVAGAASVAPDGGGARVGIPPLAAAGAAAAVEEGEADRKIGAAKATPASGAAGATAADTSPSQAAKAKAAVDIQGGAAAFSPGVKAEGQREDTKVGAPAAPAVAGAVGAAAGAAVGGGAAAAAAGGGGGECADGGGEQQSGGEPSRELPYEVPDSYEAQMNLAIALSLRSAAGEADKSQYPTEERGAKGPLIAAVEAAAGGGGKASAAAGGGGAGGATAAVGGGGGGDGHPLEDDRKMPAPTTVSAAAPTSLPSPPDRKPSPEEAATAAASARENEDVLDNVYLASDGGSPTPPSATAVITTTATTGGGAAASADIRRHGGEGEASSLDGKLPPQAGEGESGEGAGALVAPPAGNGGAHVSLSLREEGAQAASPVPPMAAMAAGSPAAAGGADVGALPTTAGTEKEQEER